MKKTFLLALIAFIFSSCIDESESALSKKEYTFKIFYNCKEKIDTFKWIGTGSNLFRLETGDLQWCSPGHKTLLSGISRYEVLSIKNIDTVSNVNISAEEKLFHKK